MNDKIETKLTQLPETMLIVIVVTPTYTNEYEDYYTRIERRSEEHTSELQSQ